MRSETTVMYIAAAVWSASALARMKSCWTTEALTWQRVAVAAPYQPHTLYPLSASSGCLLRCYFSRAKSLLASCLNRLLRHCHLHLCSRPFYADRRGYQVFH